MSVVAIPEVANLLIERLPRAFRDRFLDLCEPVDLKSGAVLCEAHRPLRHAYFPLTGFISVVATVNHHPPVEIGQIGNEGMLGATLALGVGGAGLRAIVQGSGSAMRMSSPRLRLQLRASPSLRRTLNRYLFVLLAQQSQSIACTCFHEIKSRLARWLLMTHDRALTDQIHLTHQDLADMLGVQRSAVTIAAGALQRRKLIRYVRGDILVIDRCGLEAASCECYQAMIEDHQRQFA